MGSMYRRIMQSWIALQTKFITSIFLFFFVVGNIGAQEIFKPEDVFKLKSCTSAKISPDGKWIAYTVHVQREASEEAGRAYSELYLVSTMTGETKPFVCDKVNVTSPKWSPDGSKIAFLTKRGVKAKTQIWVIPTSGGKAQQVTDSKTDILFFQWYPIKNRWMAPCHLLTSAIATV